MKMEIYLLTLQMATLDYIKIIHKQDQDKAGFSFEGERGQIKIN